MCLCANCVKFVRVHRLCTSARVRIAVSWCEGLRFDRETHTHFARTLIHYLSACVRVYMCRRVILKGVAGDSCTAASVCAHVFSHGFRLVLHICVHKYIS